MVQAPVGIRCREHGKGQKLPTYQVSIGHMILGLSLAIVVGAIGGVVLAFIVPVLGGFYGGIAMAGFGYLMGEAVTRATNYKRGMSLIVATVVGMVVASGVFLFLLGGWSDPFGLLGIGAGTYLAITRVRKYVQKRI